MRRSFAAALGTVATISGVVIGPATAAPIEDDATSVAEMPDIMGMNLKEATEAFADVAVGTDMVLVAKVMNSPFKPINKRNWVVCWQGPSAGDPIDKLGYAAVAVSRPGVPCW